MNVTAIKLSIGKLGETRIFKVVVGHLLTLETRDELRRIAEDRGTSINMIYY